MSEPGLDPGCLVSIIHSRTTDEGGDAPEPEITPFPTSLPFEFNVSRSLLAVYQSQRKALKVAHADTTTARGWDGHIELGVAGDIVGGSKGGKPEQTWQSICQDGGYQSRWAWFGAVGNSGVSPAVV
ncbi:hypothetical protein FRC08_018331 [Ceratobasidium sp. 394]|nr:hypothetical protein FRC08_018331 [Ceratobasidium sp. 394]